MSIQPSRTRKELALERHPNGCQCKYHRGEYHMKDALSPDKALALDYIARKRAELARDERE